ncbi:hypothetical protein, partial [Brucella anthropi]|uniref:hypothetical protein n=1 Tax=Brucella anthropi TaxID=529 RepID=UPI000F9DC50A
GLVLANVFIFKSNILIYDIYMALKSGGCFGFTLFFAALTRKTVASFGLHRRLLFFHPRFTRKLPARQERKIASGADWCR